MNGICNLSIIPVRFEPSERSEMVTQLLFGEMYELLDEKDDWALISTYFDHYEGWINKRVSRVIDAEFAEQYRRMKRFVSGDIVSYASDESGKMKLTLVKGSVLPMFDKGTFWLGSEKFSFDGTAVELPVVPNLSTIEDLTSAYLDCPYLWGGKSPFGIDCSGFVQIVYRFCGMDLPRDASQQVSCGETVNFIFEALQGDLAFFDNSNGNISHVGIILNDNKVIHASGKVRIDQIDHLGIFNSEGGYYSHKLRIIKRLIG